MNTCKQITVWAWGLTEDFQVLGVARNGNKGKCSGEQGNCGWVAIPNAPSGASSLARSFEEGARSVNPILVAVKERLEKQTEKGIKKYGATVNPSDYDTIGWIEHAQDELIDAIVYLETLKQKVKK